jgi:hypothetical protein
MRNGHEQRSPVGWRQGVDLVKQREQPRAHLVMASSANLDLPCLVKLVGVNLADVVGQANDRNHRIERIQLEFWISPWQKTMIRLEPFHIQSACILNCKERHPEGMIDEAPTTVLADFGRRRKSFIQTERFHQGSQQRSVRRVSLLNVLQQLKNFRSVLHAPGVRDPVRNLVGLRQR